MTAVLYAPGRGDVAWGEDYDETLADQLADDGDAELVGGETWSGGSRS